ncbi:MAG: ATP-binding protein [Flavobacteriales bacterium]|nr:ATP-binding protein [Flavobacteriales bacterium]
MQKTICFTGPESSGKTTLARQLATHFNVPLVEESARTYLSRLGRSYQEEDLFVIAGAHLDSVRKADSVPGLLIDTDLTVIKIWSQEKFGRVDERILALCNAERYDLYLLCKPDLLWQPDPQRENPFDRHRLFDIYVDELSKAKKNFRVVEGMREKRFQNALKWCDDYFENGLIPKLQ